MLLEYKPSEFIIQKRCFLKDKGKPSTKEREYKYFFLNISTKEKELDIYYQALLLY